MKKEEKFDVIKFLIVFRYWHDDTINVLSMYNNKSRTYYRI